MRKNSGPPIAYLRKFWTPPLPIEKNTGPPLWLNAFPHHINSGPPPWTPLKVCPPQGYPTHRLRHNFCGGQKFVSSSPAPFESVKKTGPPFRLPPKILVPQPTDSPLPIKMIALLESINLHDLHNPYLTKALSWVHGFYSRNALISSCCNSELSSNIKLTELIRVPDWARKGHMQGPREWSSIP